MARGRLAGRAGAGVLALLLVVAPACGGSGEADRAERADPIGLLAVLEERPARVVVISDSIGELARGWRDVWRAIDGQDPEADHWLPPFWANWLEWDLAPGESTDIGLNQRGIVLDERAGRAGTAEAGNIPTTLDVYYSAAPDGARVDVRIDGEVVDTIDTSRTEDGDAVEGRVAAQLWRSPVVAGQASWTLEVVGPGTAQIEAVNLPPEVGIDAHGFGRSGTSTRILLDRGDVIAHLEAMTARGEPPDLVIWAADTAEGGELSERLADVAEAFAATRRAAPEATLGFYVPTGHNGRDDWGRWAEAYRDLATAEGAVVLDGWEGLGDVSRDGEEAHLASDGVHLNVEGRRELTRVWLEVLDPEGPWREDG